LGRAILRGAELAQWLTHGKLKYREDIARGIENAPQAFIGMLQGKTVGKQLVQIAEVWRTHRTRRGAACAVV
jgi:NADPH-dependent curcumin reductase CurA